MCVYFTSSSSRQNLQGKSMSLKSQNFHRESSVPREENMKLEAVKLLLLDDFHETNDHLIVA